MTSPVLPPLLLVAVAAVVAPAAARPGADLAGAVPPEPAAHAAPHQPQAPGVAAKIEKKHERDDDERLTERTVALLKRLLATSKRSVGVSDGDKQIILDEHNRYRSDVSPTATNMEKMYWDDKIAVIAQNWANTCPPGHDTNEERKVPGYGIWIGQNWARGYSSWAGAIKAWHDEVHLYRYGEDPDVYLSGDWGKIGHYTQVVRDISSRIGCGYAACASGPIYICNYAHGNPQDWGKPYESGTSCSSCPQSCSNHLCDCNGLLCLNGGTINPDTCTCSCTALYGGDQCQNLECPDNDASHCGVPQPYGFTADMCHYSNVPMDCPIMCGKCPGDGTGDSGTDPNLNCPVLDPSHCSQWSPVFCDVYDNVLEECPIMCEKCPVKCPGIDHSYCKYGGSLQADCTCKCKEEYTGTRCEKLKSCPDVDGDICHSFYQGAGCEKEDDHERLTCPYLCGLC